MPRRRKKKPAYKRRRRRTYRRRTRWRRRRKSYISDTIFPKQKVVKMKYQTLTTLDPTSTSLAYHRYNLSSVYDPDYDSVVTDASARTFDECVGQAYNRYLVLGAKISIRPFGPDTRNASNAPAATYGVMMFPRDNKSLLSAKNV